MHPKIWEASGHVGAFNDPLVDCKHCKARFRADELTASEQTNWKEMICPKCGTKGSLTEPRQFNLMFKTHIGPVQSDSNIAYLRPETAQGLCKLPFSSKRNATEITIWNCSSGKSISQ